MLTPQQLAYCADDILRLYSALEEQIVRDIARRIVKTGVLTETGKIQLNALQNVGMLHSDILSTAAQFSGQSENIIKKLFEDAAITATEYDNEIYRANGLNPKSIKVSPSQLQVLEAGCKKTNGNIANLTRTTAVTSQSSFINACSLAELKVESGAFSYNQAIVDAVKQVAENGAYVLYPSGHRDRLDVAVRRNVMTGLGQTTGEICLANARELGCDLVEITAHAGARPSHASWQGQIVSLSGRRGYLALSDIGYGTGDGFKGWNCRHDWFPYFEGSTRMYSAKDIEELNAADIKFPDSSMHTLYEAEQYQRACERKIRETKRLLSALDEAKTNLSDSPATEDIIKLINRDFEKNSVKLKRQESELKNFCSKTGLLPDGARSQVYGFGRSTAQKVVWVNKKYINNSAARNAIKNTGALLEFNKNADFSIILNGYDKNILTGLSKASIKVTTLGGKDGIEHLVLVDLATGEEAYYEKGTANSVGFEKYRDFIKSHKNNKYAFVHNHNTDGCFSETDMRTLLTTDNIDMFIASRIDGIRYVVEKLTAAPNYAFFDKLFPDEITELNLKYKNGIITAGERTRLREEIIVDGLIKKFTKGLIELE